MFFFKKIEDYVSSAVYSGEVMFDELIRIAGKHDNIITKIFSAPGLWMQRITTKEPTDDMIEVAIASIKAVVPGTDKEASQENE